MRPPCWEERRTDWKKKAYLYGLAAGGVPGVRKAIDMLEDELERAMGLLGTRTVQELKERGPDLIRKRNTPAWPPPRTAEELPSKFAATG